MIEPYILPCIDFRNRLIAEMKRQGISIPKMSRLVACNQQTLYNYFAGRTSIGSNLLAAILSQLGGQLSFENRTNRSSPK